MKLVSLSILLCSTAFSQAGFFGSNYTAAGAGHVFTIQAKTAPSVTASGPSTTCTFSPTATAGDLIVVFATHGSFATATTIVDDKSNTYHSAEHDGTNSGYNAYDVRYAWGVTAATSVVTISTTAFTVLGGACLLIHDSAGAYAADPLDIAGAISVDFTGTNSYTFPSTTPSQSDGVAVATVVDTNVNTASWTGTALWTVGSNTTTSPELLVQYLANTSITTYAPVVTSTSSGGNYKRQGSVVVFKHQ